MKNNKARGLLQFIKFGMVGVLNTIICYVVYAILLRVGAHYLLANFVGFLVSVLNAFYWNNKYVFKDESGRNMIKALLKSVTCYAFGSLFLASVLLWIWIDIMHISPYISQALNLLITVPVNFLLNKFWAFQ